MILARRQTYFQDHVLLLCDLRGSFCFRPIFLHSSDITRSVDQNSHVSHLYHIMFLHLRKIYKTNAPTLRPGFAWTFTSHPVFQPFFASRDRVNPHFSICFHSTWAETVQSLSASNFYRVICSLTKKKRCHWNSELVDVLWVMTS